MNLNFSLYQPYLAILLPLLMPYLADGLASILSQDGFSPIVNDSLAWLFLIVASVASGIIDNQFFNTPDLIINGAVSIATLLLAGPLTSLRPWINFTGFLQSRVFNVVKSMEALPIASQPLTSALLTTPPALTPDMLNMLASLITSGLKELFVQSPVPAKTSLPVAPTIPPQPTFVQQVPFPGGNTASTNNIPLPGNAPTRHFGDTGLTPVISTSK